MTGRDDPSFGRRELMQFAVGNITFAIGANSSIEPTTAQPTSEVNNDHVSDDIAGSIIDFDPDGGAVTPGQDMVSRVTVENTGDTDHTFFVGYSLIGPDGESYYEEGETGTPVTLEPGERTTAEVSWTPSASAPTGAYDALTILWEESDNDDLETPLDEAEEPAAFELEEVTVDGQIIDFESEEGTVERGEEMASTVTVENTGNVEHTFFVGYSLIGPDDDSYYEEGETGTPVTLEPGEQTTVAVRWTVTSSAPTGVYDANTIIWEESDRNDLQTPLDEATNPDVFKLDEDTRPEDLFTPALHGFGFPNWGGKEGCAVDADPCPDDDQFTVDSDSVGVDAVLQAVGEWSIDIQEGTAALLARIIHSELVSHTATNGHSYGMVFAAQQYYNDSSQLPAALETASEVPNPTGEYAAVGDDIRDYQTSQLSNSDLFWLVRLGFQLDRVDYEHARNQLLTAIDEHGTAGIALGDSDSDGEHQVLAYQYEEEDDGIEVFVYDPNERAQFYRAQGDQYETPATSFVIDPGTGELIDGYQSRYDQYAYIDPEVVSSSGHILAGSVDDLLAPLADTALFRLNSPATLTVDAPESATVVHPEAEFEHDETLSDFAYVADAEPADYEVTVSGEDDGEYTLDTFVTQNGEMVLEDSISGSITTGEEHGFTVSVQTTSEETTVQRTEDAIQEDSDTEADTQFPTWLPIVGGATGLTAVAVGAYTYLSNREDESEEKRVSEADQSHPATPNGDQTESASTPPREDPSTGERESDEQTVSSPPVERHIPDEACPQCGSTLLDEAQFCHECGYTLEEKSQREQGEKEVNEAKRSHPATPSGDRTQSTSTPPREDTSPKQSSTDRQPVTCPRCESPLLDEAQFCHECGYTLEEKSGESHDVR